MSGANYLGEVVEWWGFAVATCSFPAFAFAFFSTCSLGPRAVHHHRCVSLPRPCPVAMTTGACALLQGLPAEVPGLPPLQDRHHPLPAVKLPQCTCGGRGHVTQSSAARFRLLL